MLKLSEAERGQLDQINTSGSRASWRHGSSTHVQNIPDTSDTDVEHHGHGPTPDTPQSTKSTDHLVFEDAPTKSPDDMPPPDVCASAYIMFVIMGSGLLFPWNAIIQAIDFFLVVFPGTMIETQLAIAYMVSTMMAMFGVLIFNKFVTIKPRWKTTLGFSLMLLAIVVFTIMGEHIQIWMCLLMTVIAGLGDGLAQTALYGLAGTLPPRYTGAVMIGNGISGIIVTVLKVATKVSFEENLAGLLNASRVFFAISTIFCLACIVSVLGVEFLPVVKYHRRIHTQSSGDDAKARTSPQEVQDTSAHAMNESAVGDADIVLREKVQKPKGLSYGTIVLAMRHPAFCIMGTFALTLAVYPGLTLSISSSAGLKEGWFPVALVGTFNFMDFVGRWVLRWDALVWKNQKLLWIPTLVRALVLFPLIFLCAASIIQSDVLAYLCVAMLGLSNGYIGSNCMMLGPQQVVASQQEHAGVIMACLLLVGLTIGAILGELFPFILEDLSGS